MCIECNTWVNILPGSLRVTTRGSRVFTNFVDNIRIDLR
jgi:hypothetical protein